MRTKPLSHVPVMFGEANTTRCNKRGGNYTAPGRGSTWLVDAAFVDGLTEADAAEIRRKYQKKNKASQAATETTTQAANEAPAQASEADPTQAATETTTQAANEAPTEANEADPTQAATETTTQAANEAPTEASEADPTQAATETTTQAANEAPTEASEADQDAAETINLVGAEADDLPPIIKPCTELYRDMFRINNERWVELRGQQGVMSSIRILASDLGEVWGMANIRKTILQSYTLGTDYWKMRVPNRLTVTKYSEQIYVSYPAMLTLAQHSKKKKAATFASWVAEVACIAQTGTDEQRGTLASSIAQGLPAAQVISFHKQTACGALRVLYLASLGLVRDVRQGLGILTQNVPDDWIVFKAGKAVDYTKRLQGHQVGLGALPGVAVNVVCDVHLGHLEKPDLAGAETKLQHSLWGAPDGSMAGIGIHLNVTTRADGFSELMALDPKLLSVARNLYEKIRLQYGSDTQAAAIRELETELKHKEETMALERKHHLELSKARQELSKAQQETIEAQKIALAMAARL